MRTTLRSRLSLLFMSFALLLALPAMAFADNTVADGDGAVAFNDSNMVMGAVCSGVESSKTAPVKITRQGNATGTNTFANSATVTVTASVTGAGLTAEMASPNTITLPSNWTSVDNGTLSDSVSSTVKVNSSVAGPGSGTVTYSATGKNSSGDMITRTDNMSVTWTTSNCDTTAPTVSSIVRANANPTNDASESWNVTFSESVTGVNAADFNLANTGLTGPSITGVTGSGANYTVTANTGSGDGTLGLNLVDDDSIVDGASNKLGGPGTTTTGNGSFTGEAYTIDKTKPVISASAKTQPGGANYTAGDWTNKSVEVSFSCVDSGGSDIDQNTIAGSTLAASGADQSVTNTGTCTDKAGNVATSATFSNIDIDKVAPTISRDAVKSGTLGLNGWYTTDVGYGFTASDALSGLAEVDQAFTKNITTEGSAQKVSSGTVTDLAGNEAIAIYSPDFKIDKTKPVISRDAVKSGTLGNNGWYTSNVEYGFTASDGANGSGLAPADQAFSRLIQTEGSAQNVASGTVKDLAGHEAVSIYSPNFKIDKTAPINVSGSPDRAADSNGWYNHAVGFTFSGTDATSGIASCSTPSYNGPDGTGLTVNGSCTDLAGNQSASVASSAFKYDATAPVNVSGSLARAADHNGWYNAAVGYSFSGTDATSGIDNSSCSSGTYSGPDGTGLTVSGSCADLAGNSANGSTPAFKFDDTNPTLAPSVSPNPVQLNGSALASANATDATSLVASQGCDLVDASSVGAKSVSCSAADNAGNTNSASANYSVVYGGGFGGILQPINGGLTLSLTTTQGDAAFGDDNSRVKLGSTVPLKFQLKDANGALVSNAIARLHVRKLDSTPDAGVDETLAAVSASSGNQFRYDATSGQYIFNLSTKNVHTNPNGTTVTFTQGTYNVAVLLEDGTLRSFNFNILK